jgi:hypothetical protein
MPSHPNHICSICGETVELEFCKSDESGQVVHEKCYVAKMAADSTQLHQAIRALLLDIGNAAAERSCPTCGGQLTLVAVTFYFDNLPWEVKLPMCADCTEESTIPSLKDLD